MRQDRPCLFKYYHGHSNHWKHQKDLNIAPVCAPQPHPKNAGHDLCPHLATLHRILRQSLQSINEKALKSCYFGPFATNSYSGTSLPFSPLLTLVAKHTFFSHHFSSFFQLWGKVSAFLIFHLKISPKVYSCIDLSQTWQFVSKRPIDIVPKWFYCFPSESFR